MEQLKRCPFCGGEMYIGYRSAWKAFSFWHKDERYQIKCPIRKFEIPDNKAGSLDEAIEKWNTRTERNEE